MKDTILSKDTICIEIGDDHSYNCTTVAIGRAGENAITQLEITIPEELSDFWAYLDFKKPKGEKFKTSRLDIVNNTIEYDVPMGLLNETGNLEVQLVLQSEKGEIWKSSVKKYVVLKSIDAVDDIPFKEDFVTGVQALLDAMTLSQTVKIRGEGVTLTDVSPVSHKVHIKCSTLIQRLCLYSSALGDPSGVDLPYSGGYYTVSFDDTNPSPVEDYLGGFTIIKSGPYGEEQYYSGFETNIDGRYFVPIYIPECKEGESLSIWREGYAGLEFTNVCLVFDATAPVTEFMPVSSGNTDNTQHYTVYVSDGYDPKEMVTDANGELSVNSISPNMTIWVNDDVGATITYNRDVVKAITNLENAIGSVNTTLSNLVDVEG